MVTKSVKEPRIVNFRKRTPRTYGPRQNPLSFDADSLDVAVQLEIDG